MVGLCEIIFDCAISRRRIERIGPAFLNSKKNLNCDCKASDVEEGQFSDNLAPVSLEFLKSLDPKEWKDQDHYAVLGLGKLRFHSTTEDVRRAYRKMVLEYHPDKRKAKGEKVNDDNDYFTCITKAYEILGTLKTKRAYDSIDPFFDDSLPSQSDVENNFYVSFKKYFDLNARWSERNNVPSFGDDSSSREDVEKFYKFWYDFKSWREFSYLDEENKEKGQDRDERRWIEKENKVARIKRKKEEMARIRSLVDLAYNNDKRIQKFKNEDKERKLATKKAKMDAAQAMKAEQERILRETQLAKERAEKAEQKRIEQIRIQKEQLKKALRKERRVLRDRIKDYNYFQNYDKDMMKIMEGVEKICECCNLEELQELNRNLLRNDPCETFFKALDNANEKIASDRKETIRIPDKVATNNDVKEVKKSDIWTDKNMELLIKAVNLFPAGTFQRWDVIAAFINQHAKNDNSITSRDVLVKVKYLQSNNFSKNSMKVVDSKQQNNCDNFGLKCNSKDTNNTDDVVVTNAKLNGATDKNKDVENSQLPTESRSGGQISTTTRLWTKEEQILLEQAIRTYPATTPERWERVAECIPNRTKKDCLRRVKELVELVNAKKEAQEHVK